MTIKPDLKLGPARRIKRRSEFLQIQTEGRKVRSKYFLLIHRPRLGGIKEKADTRIGITITTKVDKRAARRNRLRRRIRDIFRHLRGDLRNAIDVVVIALNGAVDLKYQEIEKELCTLLQRAHIFRPKTREG